MTEAKSPPAPPRLRPHAALAWSEANLDAGLPDRPALALWLPEATTVAIGLAQDPERELDVEAMRRDGVGLVRRASGGGAVLLYQGVLCWEAWAETGGMGGDGGIRRSYAFLAGPVIEGLATLGVEAFQAGVSDLSTLAPSVAGPGGAARKLAGTAQLRRRDRALVHGSLLVEADLGKLDAYLRFPSSQPDYRRDRTHREFCATVRETAGWAAEGGLVQRVAAAIRAAAADLGWELRDPSADAPPAAQTLLTEKYDSPAWNWRKIRPSGDRP